MAVWCGLLLYTVFLPMQKTQAVDITDVKPGIPYSLRVPDTDLDINGCVAPGSLVTILDAGAVIGVTAANSAGQYAQSFYSQTAGIHPISVYFQDSNNINSSTASELIALVNKTLTTRTIHPAPTLKIVTDSVFKGQQISLSGYGCPNVSVEVLIDNNLSLNAETDASGLWSLSFDTTNFYIGLHTFTVSASGPGYQSKTSQKYAFTVKEEPAEQQPTLNNDPDRSVPNTNSQSALTSRITDPGQGYVSTGQELVLTGTGPINSQIEIYVNDRLIGSVFTNARGDWTMKIYLEDEITIVKTRACTQTACGPFSEEVRYYLAVKADTVCTIELRLSRYRFPFVVTNTGIDLDIVASNTQDTYSMTVDWGDLTIDRQTAEYGSSRLHHNYSQSGNYNGYVLIENGEDCSRVAYFSVRVSEADRRDWVYLLIIGLFVLTAAVRAFAGNRYRV